MNGELGITQLGMTELGMTELDDAGPTVLLIDDAVQAQAADSPQLSFERILTINDAVQNQAATSPVFDLNGTTLLISSAVQLQIADSPVFIGPPSTIPPLPDFCWPVDTSCCPEYADYPAGVRARAEALAAQTMRMLTGYRVGGCPITIRPCKPVDCFGQAWHTWQDTGYGTYQTQFMPVQQGGEWLNIPCCGAPRGCSCTKVCEIELPGPVGRIDQIKIDGAVVDPATYRVDNGVMLVRQGTDDCWPTCQDMTAAPGSPNTFTVTYLNAIPVDGLGAYAAGILACEFAKACSGDDCRLPRGATTVARQGVTITLQQASFPDGFTGIPEVDTEIRRWNPHALKAASRVWSPSLARRQPRRTTWTDS